MNTESYLTIPCHWDLKILKEILEQNVHEGIVLKEMYGTIPRAPVGHGRTPLRLKSIRKEEIYSFRNILKKNKINFAYILNSPFSKEELQQNNQKVKKYIKWILEKIKPDSIIISSIELMKMVRKMSKIPITISTISRVKDVKDLKRYLEIKPSKVVVQYDINRNFKELQKLVKFTKKHKILLEVMLTESCIQRCPFMIEHYKTVGKGKSDALFHKQCNIKKITSPEELLLGNFIRPEDMKIYEEMGIHHFKITGRSKKSIWLPVVINAYRKRKFDGNLIRLLGIDPLLNAEEDIYISNLALNGFLKSFPRKGGVKAEKEYGKKWIKRLHFNGDFLVNNLEYKEMKGTLVPTTNVEDLPKIKKVYSKY